MPTRGELAAVLHRSRAKVRARGHDWDVADAVADLDDAGMVDAEDDDEQE